MIDQYLVFNLFGGFIMLKNVPNALTIIRMFLIPLILYFVAIDNYIAAAIILIISGITDIADGYIARKFNLITDFGKLVDPLADKLTQISTLIAIVVKGIIPTWILTIFILKEVAMVCGASFLYGRNLVVSSKWYGKLATVVLYIAIFISMMIRQFNLTNPWIFANSIMYYIAIACTLFSLCMYFKLFFFNTDNNILKSKETEKNSIS